MATITTDTFLDNGTARTSSESWNLQAGATLTVRTDTRRFFNGPPSMFTCIGAVAGASNGGGSILVDGSNVRWMPFDSGSGTCPATGSTISQGATNGYLLGIWADYTSAPLSNGAAMPATGFIKFREVTGAFTAGALTGISANATGPDVVGWIEFVSVVGAGFSLAMFGKGFRAYGEWFDLGTTTGTAGQTIQFPTNGGGAGTVGGPIQIETAPGSGVYEWFCPIQSTTYWSTSYLTTDVRAKFVESLGNGLLRIGANGGGTLIGYLPPAGCKIRCGNIMLRYCAFADARNINTVPNASCNSRFNLGVVGKIILDKVDCSSWGLGLASPFTEVSISNTGFNCPFEQTTTSVSVTDSAFGAAIYYTSPSSSILLKNVSGSVSNCVFVHPGSNATITDCSSFSASNITVTKSSNSTSPGTFSVANSANVSLNGVSLIGMFLAISTSNLITVTNYDATCHSFGPTTASSGTSIAFLNVSTSSNIVLNGFSFGFNGLLANCHPRGQLFTLSGDTGGIKIRNGGSFVSPLSSGSSVSTTGPEGFTNFVNNSNFGVEIKRVYLTGIRSTPINLGTLNKDFEITNCSLGLAPTPQTYPNAVNLAVKGLRVSNIGFNSVSVDQPFIDCFTGDTTGKLCFLFQSRPSSTNPFITPSFSASQRSGYSNTSSVELFTGDSIILETPYWVLGHTAFANSAISWTTGASLAYSYALDTGSGFGAWVALSLANLLTETISSSGFRMRLKVESSGTNSIQPVIISTESTSAAQTAALYPLDTNTIELTGLVAGSEVRAYTGTDPATAVEIGGTESSGTSFSFTHSAGGSVGFIRVFALGYQPYNYDPYTYEADDVTLLVQQVVDRNYVNP